MEKPSENSIDRFYVNCFAMRKDEWMLAYNCSVSPGVSPRVEGRYYSIADIV
jgi:hypothetical protein